MCRENFNDSEYQHLIENPKEVDNMEKAFYEEIEQTLVKEEWMEDMPERGVGLEGPSENQLTAVDPTVKCGEIFLRGKGRSFTFICAICSNPFVSLESFGQHVEFHLENGKALPAEYCRQDPLAGPLLFPQLALVQENEPPIELIDIKREDCEDGPSCIEANHKIHEQSGLDHLRNPVQGKNNDSSSYETTNLGNSIKSKNNDGSSNETSLFPCQKCDRIYKSKRALQTHVKKLHGEKLLSGFSDRTYQHSKALRFQEKTDHSLEETNSTILSKLNKCDIRENSEETQLKSNNEEKFSCEFCNRTYTAIKTLRRHVKLNHGEKCLDTNEAICRYCSKTFSTKGECNAHVDSEHPGINKFSCPHCPKLFKHPVNLRYHIFTHTGERPFKCNECCRGFVNQSSLDVHIRQHKQIKNHTCTFCSKSFVTSFEKKQHEKTHTGEKPHQCEECGARFASLQWLKGHLAKHRNIKNYKCDMCDKAYFTKSMLKEHIPSHSSERPYSCKICGKSFPRKTALYVHQQLHSGVKKFVCNVCDKAFAQRSGLYYHKKSNACVK